MILEHVPQQVKATADVGVWSIAFIGWFGLIQPALTALATILAIVWTAVQLYNFYSTKRKKNG